MYHLNIDGEPVAWSPLDCEVSAALGRGYRRDDGPDSH